MLLQYELVYDSGAMSTLMIAGTVSWIYDQLNCLHHVEG